MTVMIISLLFRLRDSMDNSLSSILCSIQLTWSQAIERRRSIEREMGRPRCSIRSLLLWTSMTMLNRCRTWLISTPEIYLHKLKSISRSPIQTYMGQIAFFNILNGPQIHLTSAINFQRLWVIHLQIGKISFQRHHYLHWNSLTLIISS